MRNENLYMCPECGVILKGSIWKRHRSSNGVTYYCEGCKTKNHKDDLRRVLV